MNKWTTIISCTYSHEAHLIKGKLESEGIDVVLQDELTSQINVFNSCAVGGIKVQVNEVDLEDARRILIEAGYISEAEIEADASFAKFDAMTAKLPVVGSWPIEKRLFAAALFVLIVIILPIMLLLMP